MLGSQIAYQTAYAGFHTTVYLRSEASVERAKPKVARLHEIYRAELTAAKAGGGPVSRGLVFNETDLSKVNFDQLLATGAPMGPFRILDVVGITTAYNIASNYPDAKDSDSLHGRIARLLKEEYIDKGKTGLSAGEGFYKYN